jgi:cell division protein FtsQ
MKVFRRQAKKQNRRLPQKQEKAVRQWRFHPLLGLPVVGLLLAGGGYGVWHKLADPHTLPLQQVRLEAPFSKVAKEQLYAVVKGSVNGGFFSVDVEAITAALTALPWVDKAEVRRVWPDTLNVTVTEQVALARWRDKALVNLRGELFSAPVETFPEGLVELDGPELMVGQMAERFHRFSEILQKTGLGLQRVVLTPRRAWELQLSDQTQIILGRDDMQKRLQRYVRFHAQLAANARQVKRVDMRYTNGFAVQWQV